MKHVNKAEFLKALNDYEAKHDCKLDHHISTICEPAMHGYYDLNRKRNGHVLLIGKYFYKDIYIDGEKDYILTEV